MTHRENVAMLLALIQSYAPNGQAQMKVSRILHAMQNTGEDEKFIEQSLATLLSDGLSYGSWPW